MDTILSNPWQASTDIAQQKEVDWPEKGNICLVKGQAGPKLKLCMAKLHIVMLPTVSHN